MFQKTKTQKSKSKVVKASSKTSRLKKMLAVVTILVVAAGAGTLAWTKFRPDNLKAIAGSPKNVYQVHRVDGGAMAINACRSGEYVVFIYKLPWTPSYQPYKFVRSAAIGERDDQGKKVGEGWLDGVVNAISVYAPNGTSAMVSFETKAKGSWQTYQAPQALRIDEKIPACVT